MADDVRHADGERPAPRPAGREPVAVVGAGQGAPTAANLDLNRAEPVAGVVDEQAQPVPGRPRLDDEGEPAADRRIRYGPVGDGDDPLAQRRQRGERLVGEVDVPGLALGTQVVDLDANGPPTGGDREVAAAGGAVRVQVR